MTDTDHDARRETATERTETVVVDIEDLILEEMTERGIDPATLEIVRSKTTDDGELVVQARGGEL